jgi:hypothetical protein
MILEIRVTLRCERPGCRSRFLTYHPKPPGSVNQTVDSARSLASAAGWGRFRWSTTASIGDYCPRCVSKAQADS